MRRMRIAAVTAPDVPALVDHLDRTRRASGRGGELIYRARSADEPLAPDLAETVVAALAAPLDEPGWMRAWALWDDSDGTIRGHVDLRAGALASDAHRGAVTLGLEAAHRRQGWGRRLMREAIVFARARGLAWIDLGVFAHNAPARALYAALGFEELGVIGDRFRIDGRSIDDVQMTLRL